MCRKALLGDITSVLEDLGFVKNNTKSPFTYQYNVKYPSLFKGKSDHAHFILYTPKRVIQLVAKYQESSGTAMEKLGYTVMDAARTLHDNYVVVCGGDELLKHDRAIDFINNQKVHAPRLHALRVQELRSYLLDDLTPIAA